MRLPRNSLAGYAAFIFLSVIWGIAFVAIRQADFELSPVNLTLVRWFITAALFLLLLPLIGRPKTKFEWNDVPRLLVVALANVAGYHLFLNSAEVTISAGLSSLLIALGPVFMVVLSALLLHEKAGSRILPALALAVGGTFVLSIGSFSVNDLSSFIGPGEAVVSAFCYALFTVAGKPLTLKYGSAPTTIFAGLVGTAMLLPLVSTSFFAQVGALSEAGWVSVLYLSVLSSALGYLLFYAIVSKKAVTKVSIQLYLIPIVSVIGGVVFLSETVTAYTVAGGFMMLVAVGLATSKK